ncbi:MAG TPA: hypothetical protein VGN17_05345 [Bryobacteraceae bacterium]
MTRLTRTEARSDDQPAQLPDNFRPLFWSYRFEALEARHDEKAIIVQLINYGGLQQWQWLVRQYGTAEIKEVLQSIPATEIKPRARELASLLFSIPTWRHAHRGTH